LAVETGGSRLFYAIFAEWLAAIRSSAGVPLAKGTEIRERDHVASKGSRARNLHSRSQVFLKNLNPFYSWSWRIFLRFRRPVFLVRRDIQVLWNEIDQCGSFKEIHRRKSRKPPAPPPEVDAFTFASTELGFIPDAQQAEVLRSTAKRGILNCSRQWGKSTVAAAKAVHRAHTRPESLVLVASPSERQSAEFLRKASGLVRQLNIRPRGDGDNATSLLLPNGSRIVGLPGTEATVRGFSNVSLLLIDEASRVPDELYQSLRPMLSTSGGDMWLMSTPWGQRGFFYETWRGSDEQWLRVSVPATECPRIPAAFLEEERGVMSGDWFGQEYMCQFTGCDDALFERQLIEDALDDTVTELNLGRK
jgi:hypothetical protein